LEKVKASKIADKSFVWEEFTAVSTTAILKKLLSESVYEKVKRIMGTLFAKQLKETPLEFAVFDCETESSWEYLYPALYQSYLQKPGEKWKWFNVTKGQYPSEKELDSLKGNILFA